MARLGPKEFQKFLSTRGEGEVITEQEILAAVPAWKKASLDTYRKKHKLESFISYMGDGRYRVVRDGGLVSEADINSALSQVSPRSLTLTRGDRLAGATETYELVQQIGRGAVGAVWQARLRASGELVAVKVCNPRPDLLEPSLLSNVHERFRKEARLGPRVEHDALVKYLDAGEHAGSPFLVMELAVESLRGCLDRVGRLSESALAEVGLAVTKGLHHLGAHSCVHRDIKPPNILVTSRGYVLGDLGILRWGDLNRDFTGAGTITKATVQLGSWNYMAPEQIANPHGVTGATDVYSLGVTFVELLTGVVPSAQMVAAGRVPPPSNTKALNDLIQAMTAYDADARPSLAAVDEVLFYLLDATRAAELSLASR